MKYEEFLEFLTYLWSEGGLFKEEAVRHKDIYGFVKDFCKKNKWDAKNWGQQLAQALKNRDIERFLYDDGVHSPRPYYRPSGSEYPPYEVKSYQLIIENILSLLSEKTLTMGGIIESLNYDKRLIRHAVKRLVKEGRIDHIPPKQTQYKLKK